MLYNKIPLTFYLSIELPVDFVEYVMNLISYPKKKKFVNHKIVNEITFANIVT